MQSGKGNVSEICWMKICFMHWECADYTDSSDCSAQSNCVWDIQMEECTHSIF